MQPKRPQDCRTLADIRREIDRIDRDIIRAIGERKRYVVAPAEAAAPGRFAAMLHVRRQWAEEEGISPEVIEKTVSRPSQPLHCGRAGALVEEVRMPFKLGRFIRGGNLRGQTTSGMA